jgi:selenide,water dikinase
VDPDFLVGFDKADDAGVYRISEGLALVQTVDFFTPVVDDPYLFGQIAAANSLSDVYAMGGKPLTAMNIACFPCNVEPSVLAEILSGGADKIREAGAVLVGGHTISDNEIKYGLSVTGTVAPERVVTNSGALPGDVLILTKPLGTGIISTAFKFDVISEADTNEAAISMSALNKTASEAMQRVGVHACTDITGFGLLGHGCELAEGSGVGLRIFSSDVPVMKNVLELIEKDCVPGGAYSNMDYFGKRVSFDHSVNEAERVALFDPQTSGGLLISVSREKAPVLLEEMNRASVNCRIIGEVLVEDLIDAGASITVV